MKKKDYERPGMVIIKLSNKAILLAGSNGDGGGSLPPKDPNFWD